MQKSNQDQHAQTQDAGKKNDQVPKQDQGSKQDQVAEQDVSGAKTAQQKDNETNPKLKPIHNNLETNKGQ